MTLLYLISEIDIISHFTRLPTLLRWEVLTTRNFNIVPAREQVDNKYSGAKRGIACNFQRLIYHFLPIERVPSILITLENSSKTAKLSKSWHRDCFEFQAKWLISTWIRSLRTCSTFFQSVSMFPKTYYTVFYHCLMNFKDKKKAVGWKNIRLE